MNSATEFPVGDGAMGAAIRDHDWRNSPLGPVETWSATLRTSINIVLASAFPAFIVWGPELTIIYNDAYSPILADKHPGALGRSLRDVWSEIWAVLAPLVERTMVEGQIHKMEDLPLAMQRKGYVEDTWFDYSYGPIRDDGGNITGLICHCVETTAKILSVRERDRAQQSLADRNRELEHTVAAGAISLRLFESIVQSDTSPILAFDHAFRVIAFNRAHREDFLRVMGHSQMLGDVLPDLFPAEQGEALKSLMVRALSGERFVVVEEFGDPSREKPTWEITYTPLRDGNGHVFGAFHHARDISERVRAEAELQVVQEQLRQSQKMEAVGQLTGGLAHDFNNLLAGISGSLEMMMTRIKQGRLKDVDKYMVAAQGASRRAAALTHRLLAFSRRQTLTPTATNVNTLINGMLDLIQRTVGPNVQVETVCMAGLWPTLVDQSQLENALLNLCINARDAMMDGGQITIETSNRWIDRHGAKHHDVPEGQYLSLCVSDTGTGMPPDVIAKAFDPFFTTKPIGMGTGLGLSMIYGFAKQSGGQVRIYSEMGQGTTVRIYLPRYRGDAEQAELNPEAATASVAGAGETVLIVDDEPTVRMLVADVLGDLSYTALEAIDGAGGLKLLQSNVRIDLLITDVGLPGMMNGRQMADAARVHRPNLKVLFITGFAENALLKNGQLEPGMSVLTKPFAVETLAARIRELIVG